MVREDDNPGDNRTIAAIFATVLLLALMVLPLLWMFGHLDALTARPVVPCEPGQIVIRALGGEDYCVTGRKLRP